MSKTKKIILAINLLLVLVFFVLSVLSKESTLANSRQILVQLAPVDPRSLMQGDYMALNYSITGRIWDDGGKYIVVKVDDDNVATFVRQQNDKTLNDGELLIRWTTNKRGRISIGADNYFFQEGTGDKYAVARYGLLRVDSDGNCVLVGLCDWHKQLIE
ncbi:MAG: GDYXXLXY domain-containing protein [Bacteroidales bacterium]|nr:GDYXXLXY domain-containing protein [Bacteroidales bacterium]